MTHRGCGLVSRAHSLLAVDLILNPAWCDSTFKETLFFFENGLIDLIFFED